MSDLKKLQVITQTAIRTYRKCPRLYQHQYIHLKRSVVVPEALEFGDVWHQLREVWWKAGSGRLDAALEKLRQIKQNPDFNIDDFVLAKLIVMLRGYHTRWHERINNLEILGTEIQFSIPLVNPLTSKESRTFVIQGKLDAVVKEDGKLWVVEEKTASGNLEIESPYWRRLEIDPQCSIYFYAVREVFGETPAGIMYFVNVKSQKKPLKKTANPKYKKTNGELYAGHRAEDETHSEYAIRMAEAMSENPDKYFHLVLVPRLAKDIYESQLDVWNTAKSIRESELTKIFWRNPDSCIHPFGSACSFLPVCSNRATIDDPSYYRTAEATHEELIEAENSST